jgi:hypothetical protein
MPPLRRRSCTRTSQWSLLAVFVVAGAGLGASAEAAPRAVFEPSRTSCVAPCAIFFDATQTTDADFERPFHSLFFEWSFGDDRGETWAVSGRPKHTAIGGVAGHLYTRAGEYEATLRVTNPRGESALKSARIVVRDPDAVFAGSATTCVSRAGRFDGCPAGAQRTTSGDFDASLANADGRRTLYRRGERFEWDRPIQLAAASAKGASIGAFGAEAALPVVQTLAATFFDAGEDWRVTQLALVGTGKQARVSPFRERKGVRRFTVWDVDVTRFDYCVDFFSPGARDEEVAFVEYRCREFPDPGDGAKVFEDTERSMFLGLDVDKGDMSENDNAEFVHRAVYSRRKVIQHVRYQGRSPRHSKNVLQLRHCEAQGRWASKCTDGAAPSEYVIVSDNHFVEGGGPRASSIVRVCDHQACTGAVGNSQPIQDYVFERNLLQLRGKDPTKDRMLRVFQLQARRSTVRNNVADLQGWPGRAAQEAAFVEVTPMSNPRDDNDGVWVLHNTVFMGEGTTPQIALCSAGRGSGHVCANNLLYGPGMRATRNITRGAGWSAVGNLTDGTGPGTFRGSPFEGPLAPLRATLRALDPFRLSGRVESGTNPVDAGADGKAGAPPVFVDAWLGCRRDGKPDVGANERGARPCPAIGAAGSKPPTSP